MHEFIIFALIGILVALGGLIFVGGVDDKISTGRISKNTWVTLLAVCPTVGIITIVLAAHWFPVSSVPMP